MELFAGVADMLGKGLPLAYLFISTEVDAAPYTNQTALIAWMGAIRALGIDPEFTLSDKDQSEINALKHVWPQAKHQLCLWHILRALKWCLSQNQTPGSYSALEAHDAFPDITRHLSHWDKLVQMKRYAHCYTTIYDSFQLCRL